MLDNLLQGLLQSVIGAAVWLIANAVYLDLRRKGVRGFTRFAAFWAGTPTTWISFFVVREGSHPAVVPMEVIDDEALFAEVRRDRALRDGRATGDGHERID